MGLLPAAVAGRISIKARRLWAAFSNSRPSAMQRLLTWRGAPAMTAHETVEASDQVESRARQRQLADRTGCPIARRAAKLTFTVCINGFERSRDRGGARATASGDRGVRQSTLCGLRLLEFATEKRSF